MPNPKHNTLLGFDFGLRRIGVAIGQAITKTANPLPTLAAQDGIPDWQQIQLLIETWQADGIIIGEPLNMDGTEQAITASARKFANQLKNKFNLPVYLVDERLTTIEARQQLYNSGVSGKKIKHVDSYAAKLIVEAWLQQYKESEND